MSASLKSICLSINKEDKILEGGAVAEWSEAIIMRENKRKLKDLLDKQSNDSSIQLQIAQAPPVVEKPSIWGLGFYSGQPADAQGIVGDENNLLQPWSHGHLG